MKKSLVAGVLGFSLIFPLFFFSCAKRIDFPVEKISVEEVTKAELAGLANTPGEGHKGAMRNLEKAARIVYPGDQLDILIFEKLPGNQETRMEKKKVDPDGKIHLLPLGRVEVAGLTLIQVQKEIEDRLSQYVVSPYCEVEVTKSDRRLFVFGQVTTPGTQELLPGYTVLDVLAKAGITESAYSWDVKVVRTQEDKVQIISLNLKDIFKRGAVHYNIRIQNNDIVFVPRRFLKNATEVLAELAQVTGTVLPWYLLARP